MRASRGVMFPFFRLQGAQEATMFSHTDCPPRLRGITWSTVRPAGLAPAVLAGPGVAGEHRLAGDLAPVHVARDAHVANQPDHAGPVEREPLRVQRPLAALEDLRTLLQHQHGGAPDVADVDRLVARVQHQDPAADGRDASGGRSGGRRGRCRSRALWPHLPWLRSALASKPYVRVGRRVHSATIVDSSPGRSPRRRGAEPLRPPGCRWRRSDSCPGSAPTPPCPGAPGSPRRPASSPAAPSRSQKNM